MGSARLSRPGKVLKFISANKVLMIGAAIVTFYLIVAIFPQLFTEYDPIAQDSKALMLAPSASHLFGTDNFGRDLFSRVVHATRIDLEIGIFAMLVPFVTGTTLGLIAGYYGGKIDSVLMRIIDVVMAFPFMVLVIAIVAILGSGVKNLFIAIWLVGWKEYARLVRSEVMVAKNMEYVEAARTLGYSDLRIMVRHILPNVIGSSIVYAASDIVMCIISGAGVSFLGLGVQTPTPEWGAIISDGKSFISYAWWLTVCPGIVMAVCGLGFSLLGDGISDLIREKNK